MMAVLSPASNEPRDEHLVGFFQALKKIGYQDAVSPEPLGRVPEGLTPEDGARLGLDTTLAVMKRAGVA
jgi:hypothetical protein